ncbi:MAG: hypothetical protein ABIP55_11070 [Tepidisphaeraceae bacterium]
MSTTTFLSPDRLHDRPWRPGHPLVRSPSARRRVTMLALLVFLCALIGGYLFITDSRRVRAMAQNELSRIVGGPVTVGRAKLSLFEGLKLEYVNLYADETGQPDSLVFSANQFLVSYDLRSLLTGNLKLTRIVAIDPHVQLVENLDVSEGGWNYQRMINRPRGPTTAQAASGNVPPLPEVILRNARIDYAETRAGQLVSKGTMNIEGQFAPSSDGQRYTFELQSRGGASVTPSAIPGVLAQADSLIGPTIQGVLVRNTGQITAQLKDFRFGKDIRSMLPAQVRAWWDRHNLAGAVDIPVFTFSPARDGQAQKYRVETDFRSVDLTIRPEEWMSRDEITAQQHAADAFEAMRNAGLNDRGVIDHLAAMVDPAPIKLQKVSGRFEFTEDGIVLKDVAGSLEENEFAINGTIDGYNPLSPASLQISSKKTEIPAQPRYLTSMPPQVRELYDHLRPRGLCTLAISVNRPTFGGRLELAGGITILDGHFIFDRFPYPVRNATGKVVFGYDPRTGLEQVRLEGLQGRGVTGGPNADSIIKIAGVFGPLNGDVGVQVTVSSDRVRDEPALRAAFPEDVLIALNNLDADGKGEYPKFRGSFECRIDRAVGPYSLWIVDTDITLDDAAGKMVAFPYLLEHVTGKLAIREGYVDILDATMKRNDASLVIGGRVTWRAGAGGRALEPGEIDGRVTPARPDLKITARNVPIDKALLDALPEDRRIWLTKAGLTGALDIDGRVWRPTAAEASPSPSTVPSPASAVPPRSSGASELTHAFDLVLRNGTIWPVEGTFAISNITSKLRLLPDRLIISEASGKRGVADLAGRGEVSWPHNQPALFVSGTASRLELDRTLYRILPTGAQGAWDAIHPEGVVDLDISYNGPIGIDHSTTQPTSPDSPLAVSHAPPTTQPSLINNLDLIIHPVKLAVTVQAVPYRLDGISGTVHLSGGKVLLSDLTGKHGDATIRLSGAGSVEKTDWDLRLSADRIKADDAFKKALPPALASLAQSLKLDGTLDFEFPRLAIRSSPPGTPMPPASPPPTSTPPTSTPPASTTPSTNAPATKKPPTTAPDATPLDIDFHVRLGMADAALDVGVLMTQVHGKLELKGTVRGNKLAALDGDVTLPSLKLADRDAEDLHAEFFKPADHDALRIGKITGRLAGGEIAGQVDLAFPETGPSRYVMNLVLRDADVRELSGLPDRDLAGELSASFALEGNYSDIHSRRGRGDVLAVGKEMYKIPLVLGLLQITNLSLPISAPFNEGSARYSVDGSTVTFESLELRSRDMLMSGSGQLDFDTKKVRMSFTTDNPNWPKVPILGELVQTAKHELLQFHVKGTLEDPKVSSANTVTTTVYEVLRGDGKK